ncbi:hypothetical protein [Actinacidiphila acidipaludis]|uniref:Uncharacterized protein n=1 Tax=Actinacidiphila acidipaludis TaxID=2873382 RepID=A0ABS7Q9G1_9ACTN|nr:hypothetical protein [Streptomyces acidipaludis]MBY8879790.1 hypothetical protein [Streptomyces acidipaludis]
MTASEHPEFPFPDDRPGPHWLDEEVAERLLDGELDAAGVDGRAADLARLLALAASEADARPVRPDAERAVMAAFREAHAAGHRARPVRAAGAAPGRRRTRGPRSLKALAGGVAAVFVLSGVAIAAETGTLTHPFHSGGGTPARTRSASPSGTVTGSASPSHDRPAGTTGAPTHTTPGSSPSATPPSSPSPLPGVKGLCQSYAKASQHGHNLDSTAQRRLAAAAGGPAKIPAFCAQFTPAPPPGHTKPTPTASTHK